MSFEEAIKDQGSGIIVDIEVTPGSKSISIPSGYNEWRKRIEVKLTKNALKGKANEQLIECLAALFGISSSDIFISSGAASSKKSLLIKGISYQQAVSIFAAHLEKWKRLQNNVVNPDIYRKRLERVEELLSELSEYSGRGAIIIVEGKRDILSLKKLGIEGNFELATRYSLFNFSERIAELGREVIILTDWDRRGDLLAVKLSEYFKNFGLRPELQIRNKLKLISQKEIKDIESLYNYVSRLRLKTGSCFDQDIR